MPVYDTFCSHCSHIERNVYHRSAEPPPPCVKCGGTTDHWWGDRSSSVILFREGWYENLALEPMYFSSKQKLRAELKERGLQMDYVS